MQYLRLSLVAIALCAIAGYAAFARLQGGASGDDKPVRPTAASGPPGIAIVSAVAEHRDVPVVRRSVGWAEPISTVTVRARVEGEVIEQHVQEGQTVSRGDLLFRIDDREIQAALAKDEAMLARDQATLARAQADAARARDLLARKVAAQQQVDQAEADAKIAAANVQGDQAAIETDRIRLGYTEVRAPIDGRVGAVRVTPGNIVRSSDGGEGLVTVTQMKPLRVTFTLPERDLPALRTATADRGVVPVTVTLHDGAAGKASGQLSFIDSSVDSSSGTITAKALLPNDDGALWPGQYVDVEVELGRIVDAVTIPLVAVQPGQDGPFVYVVGPDDHAAIRQVTVGDTLGDAVVVREGLQAGDRVVTEGQQRLRDGSRVAERRPAAPAARKPDQPGPKAAS
jgi:multidrug efflux system membrane fusion protein